MDKRIAYLIPALLVAVIALTAVTAMDADGANSITDARYISDGDESGIQVTLEGVPAGTCRGTVVNWKGEPLVTNPAMTIPVNKVYFETGELENGVYTVSISGTDFDVSTQVVVGEVTVSLNESEKSLKAGEKFTPSPTVGPSGMPQTVVWTTSNGTVATVGSDGKVTARAVGTAVITAAVSGYPDVTAGCTVTVEPTPVEEVALDQTSMALEHRAVGQLTATVSPETATDRSVTWSSDHPEIASVDSDGKVTAVSPGSAAITVTANDGSGVTATCTVTVTKIAVTEVEIEVGGFTITGETIERFRTQTLSLNATVTPEYASYPAVTWTSGNDSVATVGSDGKVTAVSAGEATITATADEVSVSFTLKVNDYTPSDVVATVGSTDCMTLYDAVEAAKDGLTIVLRKNTASSLIVPEDARITFDMNGFSCGGIWNRGDLTVTGNGSVSMTSADGSAMAIVNAGTMEILNGTFTVAAEGSTSAYDGVVVVNMGGKLTISGGSFVAADGVAVESANYDGSDASLKIVGGSFEGKIAVMAGVDDSSSGSSVVSISGGRFVGSTADLVLVGDADITVSGGTFPSKQWLSTSYSQGSVSEEFDGTLVISGGSFGSTVPSKYLAKGYVSFPTTGSMYSVVPSSSIDDDDDPTPTPGPTPSYDDDDDSGSVKIVAIAAACVIVAVIAVFILAERRD